MERLFQQGFLKRSGCVAGRTSKCRARNPGRDIAKARSGGGRLRDGVRTRRVVADGIDHQIDENPNPLRHVALFEVGR